MAREVQSSIIEKLVVVLDVLARTPGKLSQSEIVTATGFNKSSIHRILSILLGQGLVRLDERDKTYSVGPKLVSWARSAWQKTDLAQIEDQDLIDLSNATGMNVAISVLSDYTVTFIRTRIINPYKLAVKVGGQSDLHCTAAGKLFLGFMSKFELDTYLDTTELEKYTETTLTDQKSLLNDIELARELGYAKGNREEFWQVVGIAAPIVDYDNRIMAALSLWTPTRFASMSTLEQDVPAMLETAAKISARFGSMA
ncbi:IclR family transcriptional regulator [Granulosicoccus antarcticus]|uniref:HTH-type transcriptional repressor AllR n=1 Tax=Granulosicoccus antarcticus IMCC3135 TaxID=1192854 RepID=A0A2Z2NRI8_9GAMM|nr:IclR family transcriptional regulator [Granulosicoccus antarcticus]ASJ73849.1 Transcriptional regulator KdgR [Granulosicoccus antarcticus IMCC3135]